MIQVLGERWPRAAFDGIDDDRDCWYEHSSGIGGRFTATLTFVVREEKCLVFLDRAADRGAELILPQYVGMRSGLQQRARVGGIVLQIVVDRAVKIVGARLGDDVDDAAERPAVFRRRNCCSPRGIR